MTASQQQLSSQLLDQLDPDILKRGIRELVSSYQVSRSAIVAWSIVRYAQYLCCHPDFEGSDEERCGWYRLARQWRWLASGGRGATGVGAAA